MLGKLGIISYYGFMGARGLRAEVPASSSGQMASSFTSFPPPHPHLFLCFPCDWAGTLLLGVPGALLWARALLTRVEIAQVRC